MGEREAVGRLFDEVADLVQHQYPDAEIRGWLFGENEPGISGELRIRLRNVGAGVGAPRQRPVDSPDEARRPDANGDFESAPGRPSTPAPMDIEGVPA